MTGDLTRGLDEQLVQSIEIPHIYLNWSVWYPWNQIAARERRRMVVDIDACPGVYEVCHVNEGLPLTIGMGLNLRRRIGRDLVTKSGTHSAGKNIRNIEPLHKLIIRWAPTDHPHAVEEELHRACLIKHGQLPKYTKKT